MDPCSRILEDSYSRACKRVAKSFVDSADVRSRIETVALCLKNRAGVRALLAGLLAKLDRPAIDIRKPYTDVAGQKDDDQYSGRDYDQKYIQRLVDRPYRLPINQTTAFLTPGFRTKNITLAVGTELEGRPPEMYEALLLLFDDIQKGRLAAEQAMDEVMRLLIIERNQRQSSIKNLVRDVRRTGDKLPLSAEAIVVLIGQHLACKNASRVPVLVVAAAYQCASENLGKKIRTLREHTAADRQTGAMGDVEITLTTDTGVVTAYEMKMKPVTIDDINVALRKIDGHADTIRSYIFVTTAPAHPDVLAYAAQKYDELGGIEITILDCLGFLRHFLHLFHELRSRFLDAYQDLLLAEPESAVGQSLKETFLTLRKTAQGAD